MGELTHILYFALGAVIGVLAMLVRGRDGAKPRVSYVMLRMHSGGREMKPVQWCGSRAYAAPYLPETRCLLLPQGKVDGVSYVTGWEPCDERMELHFLRAAA